MKPAPPLTRNFTFLHEAKINPEAYSHLFLMFHNPKTGLKLVLSCRRAASMQTLIPLRQVLELERFNYGPGGRVQNLHYRLAHIIAGRQK